MSKASRYTLEWVTQTIEGVGERHKYNNVFPASYYRKIMLDMNHELKVKPQPEAIEPEANLVS
jgi:hypothetical protein